jgi:protein-S-isoprenylcysteine O-methyltransferase Ste14
MGNELVYRTLYILAGSLMLLVRLYYQRKILPDRERTIIRGSPYKLIPGAIAALVMFTYGFEYIFAPHSFDYAYVVDFPNWMRWLGGALLAVGIGLLWWAHHHLGRSFHSMVASKEGQKLVESGPYRWVRHPIYTAYAMNYVGGGLLASNVVLTVVPVLFFGLMIYLRIEDEEALLLKQFGEQYREYMSRTGRFLPGL